MSKGKRRGKPGQRKGDTHYTPPKPLVVAPPNDPPKPPDVQADGAGEPESDTQELTEAVDRHVRMNTWFAGAIMVATIVQAVVSCFQWRAMDRGLNQTDTIIEQMRLEQRAWLQVRQAKIELPKKGEPIDWRLTLFNTGQMPARVLFDRVGTVASPSSMPIEDVLKRFLATPPIASNFIIAPQNSVEMSSNRHDVLDGRTIDGLASGQSKLFVIGEYVYEDDFHVPRNTKFLFEYDPASRELHGRQEYTDMK